MKRNTRNMAVHFWYPLCLCLIYVAAVCRSVWHSHVDLIVFFGTHVINSKKQKIFSVKSNLDFVLKMSGKPDGVQCIYLFILHWCHGNIVFLIPHWPSLATKFINKVCHGDASLTLHDRRFTLRNRALHIFLIVRNNLSLPSLTILFVRFIYSAKVEHDLQLCRWMLMLIYKSWEPLHPSVIAKATPAQEQKWAKRLAWGHVYLCTHFSPLNLLIWTNLTDAGLLVKPPPVLVVEPNYFIL